MPRLHIAFSGPEHGWLGIGIQVEGEEIRVNASYTPYDTLTEFAEALVQIIETGYSKPVRINEEPQESEIQFQRDDEFLQISHTYTGHAHCEPAMILRAPFRTSTREIARQLKFLYASIGYDGFVRHWQRRPPKALIARAWSHFE